jgi:RNA polymerase sigma-70 factor, ECF subfamily
MEQQGKHDRDRIWVGWMRAANAGDEIAYRHLLEALAPFLRHLVRRGFARSGFGNCDVEDVVQETLLAIHLKRQTWNDGEAITPWVTAIARHKLIDSLRRRGRHIELPIDDLIDVLPAETTPEGLSSHDAEQLLSVLRGRQRDVVRAISIEGLSAREAADRFGISEGAVRVALHRGLSALAISYRDLNQ